MQKFNTVVFLLQTIVFVQITKSETTCLKSLSVNITSGEKKKFDVIVFENVTYSIGEYFFNNNTTYGCICKKKRCVVKCCEPNEIFIDEVCQENTTPFTLDYIFYKNTVKLNNSDPRKDFHVISHQEGMIIPLEGEHFLQENGSMLGENVFWDSESRLLMYDPGTYCLELNFDRSKNSSKEIVLVRQLEEHVKMQAEKQRVTTVGMIISMPFLLATFLVYAALPDRNLHQKALMFYVFSLLMAYILLVTIQLSQQQFEVIPCKVIGFATVFFFMVSFFWMNVICIDIWFTFSGSRGFIGSQRASERRRFLFYCLYSWGMSFLQVLIVVLINEYGNEEADYYPGVGIAKCFISDGLPTLLYFYGQVAIIISVNVILFSMTAYKIRKVKKETSMLKNNDSKRHSYEKDKQKFNLYLKLLFAMGVNWSMEIISWAVNWKMGNNIPHYVWYLTDFCNAIYGVFIFFIFVFKKKIWRQLQKRYYSAIGRPHLAHSLTTTQTTRASNYSSGNYSTAETGFNSDNRTTLTEIRSTVDGTNGLRAEERPLNRR